MIQGLITAFLLVAFIAGTIWVWSSKRAPTFAAAARLPLEDDAAPPSSKHSLS